MCVGRDSIGGVRARPLLTQESDSRTDPADARHSTPSNLPGNAGRWMRIIDAGALVADPYPLVRVVVVVTRHWLTELRQPTGSSVTVGRRKSFQCSGARPESSDSPAMSILNRAGAIEFFPQTARFASRPRPIHGPSATTVCHARSASHLLASPTPLPTAPRRDFIR